MRRLLAILVAATAGLLVASLCPAIASSAVATPAATVNASDLAVCPVAAPGSVSCHVHLLGRNGVPVHPALHGFAVSPSATTPGYGPADIAAAYGLDPTKGVGQIVGIIDVYDTPSAETDLGVYRLQFGLPACTTGNGCFHKYDQAGGAHFPPMYPASIWALETDLDLQAVSAVAPLSHIVLVEATTPNMPDIDAAVNTAVAKGATEVSISLGGPEYAGETSDDPSFSHAGLPISVATGDTGYGVEYPAASPNVIAVGGTTLVPAPTSRGWQETAWSLSGSGCSAFEAKPSWQHDTGCSRRTVADVSALADPNHGLGIYAPAHSPPPASPWILAGGTSLSAPVIAGVFALAGGEGSGSAAAPLYGPPAPNYHDITAGSNGPCPSVAQYLCTAGTGYDGPTGLGTPNGVFSYTGGPPSPPPTPPPTPTPTSTPTPPTSAATGYWLVASDGGVFPFGPGAGGYGSTGGTRLNQPIVGMAPTHSGHGYWLVASDGGIFPFGDAGGYGSTGSIRLNKPIVGLAATRSGNGYWLVASDGGIFAFGDAGGYGSTGAMILNSPIVGMAATPTGAGYWLVASDGGIFPFGDAGGYGSTGNVRLNKPIVAMAATPSGKGYWLVASDGGIFPFGDAGGFGSTGNIRLNQPVIGMGATSSGQGYWMVARDGGIFPFGGAGGYGGMGGIQLNRPIVGMAVTTGAPR